MWKDPNQTSETAYELLGLEPEATLSEVREALKNFLRVRARSSAHLIPAAQQAQKRLQSPMGRAAVDIWMYDLRVAGGAEMPAARLELEELGRPRAVAPLQVYCALAAAPEDAPRREIRPHAVRFSETRALDDIDSLEFEPRFDH